MIVSLLSSSMPARKVGSSRVKRRSAFPMLVSLFESTGLMESEITGSGTCIEVMLSLTLPSVNVSPELHSMPNIATMSPVPAVLELERERHGRLVVVGREHDLRLVGGEVVGLVDHLGGVGEVSDDAVEQLLDGLVLVGRPHEDRRE